MNEGTRRVGDRRSNPQGQYLRELVYQKNKWDEPLSDEDKAHGFLGWHERGYLPHCDKPGLVQLVTLRLVDSLPASRRGEWEHLLKIEDARERRTQLESYLDRGVGECWLRDPRVAGVVGEAMRFHHGERYELLAWCVMPNHAHVLVHVWDWPLAKMLQNWKSVSAVAANKVLKRSGAFWQREYWDVFMRSAEQEKTAIRYIEGNPVKGKLCRTAEDWPFSSARFRDKYRRLVLPGKRSFSERRGLLGMSSRRPIRVERCSALRGMNTTSQTRIPARTRAFPQRM